MEAATDGRESRRSKRRLLSPERPLATTSKVTLDDFDAYCARNRTTRRRGRPREDPNRDGSPRLQPCRKPSVLVLASIAAALAPQLATASPVDRIPTKTATSVRRNERRKLRILTSEGDQGTNGDLARLRPSPSQAQGAFLAASNSTGDAASAAASSATSTFRVPAGWRTPERETDFYAVPVIIGLSVLLACLIVGAIFSSVIWRRSIKSSKAEDPEGFAEKQGSTKIQRAIEQFRAARAARRAAGAEGSSQQSTSNDSTMSQNGTGSNSSRFRAIVARSTSIVANRPRRRRRPRVSSSRSVTSGLRTDSNAVEADVVDPVLLNPLSSSRRPDGALPNEQAQQRDVETSASTHSPSPRLTPNDDDEDDDAASSASLRLARSRSTPSARLAELEQSEEEAAARLASGDPNQSPTPAASPFGTSPYPPQLVLPAPGPPAYRPATTNIRSTMRFTPSRLSSSPRTPASMVEPEEEWHWPNEKAALLASGPSSSTSRGQASSSQPVDSLSGEPTAYQEDRPEDEPADESEYAAHVATDDKRVLEQILSRAQGHGSAMLPPEASASAPPIEAEYDEEGFQRLDTDSSFEASDQQHAHASSSSSVLPAPPSAIVSQFATTPFSAASTSPSSRAQAGSTRIAPNEMEYAEPAHADLPVYQQSGSSRADPLLAMASAPPAFADDGEDGDDGDDGDDGVDDGQDGESDTEAVDSYPDREDDEARGGHVV